MSIDLADWQALLQHSFCAVCSPVVRHNELLLYYVWNNDCYNLSPQATDSKNTLTSKVWKESNIKEVNRKAKQAGIVRTRQESRKKKKKGTKTTVRKWLQCVFILPLLALWVDGDYPCQCKQKPTGISLPIIRAFYWSYLLPLCFETNFYCFIANE